MSGRGGRGGRGRGRGGGGGSSRGTGSPAISVAPSEAGVEVGLPTQGSHVATVGVKRTGYGSGGRAVTVLTNHFRCQIPEGIIYHYDAISPSEQTLPAKLNMDLIRMLQEVVAPHIFTPKAVYDGRKNMFSTYRYEFENDTQTFDVTLVDPRVPDSPPRENKRGPRVYKVKLTKVAEINPEVLSRFLEGKQSQDNAVLTAITALNVVVRMEPTLKYPFNVRSFFTDQETKDIGMGMVLWRGYFQSVRPSPGRMLVNIDISTGTMYKPGPLIPLCLEYLGVRNVQALAPPQGLDQRERVRLQRFISGARVLVNNPGQAPNQRRRPPRVIKKISDRGASTLTFNLHDGGQSTVAQYFQRTYNRALQYPTVFCVEVGNGAMIPAELCVVPPGQIMRKQVPPEKTSDVLAFSTKHPNDRLNSIKAGLGVLAYGQSEYVRQFGLHVDGAAGPLSVNARVLNPPSLMYGRGSKQPVITPREGAWNMADKKFYNPAAIDSWVVVIYERQARFNQQVADDMVKNLLTACRAVGIAVREQDPVIRWESAQGRITEQMRNAGHACRAKNNKFPDLIVVVLPEGATNLYVAIKHFGDIQAGVATQCLKALKCGRGNAQYFANVCLKINVKRGGVNTIPEARAVSILTDAHNPTIVMGADVIHPAAHSEGRPSFTALVANVDANSAKYIADCRVQASRQEMIEDLEAMTKSMLEQYMGYRRMVEKQKLLPPKRILFYRDGVSEGQFRQVLDIELPRIKRACESLNIDPKITIIVVGKRHHVRFFPKTSNEGDKRSGNCFAGTVVDRDITHPIEQDFYLQSHAGLLGTSRPAHYNVLYDENNFQADGLQQLSFALCHVYARSTRSVSIPAPVYYADIVCSRAKHHYDPDAQMDFTETETATGSDALAQLKRFQSNFKPLHATTKKVMYFS
ncbi:argonaute-like protein [Cristinia sonorae]|uniref:Argonaute-like protein n=1 Tax=Cristinia sonorae TaxID=1940300 RepID=A0A8K0UVP4_9AGAR|nr:argonaute-like protein [Cristinia sonorae]